MRFKQWTEDEEKFLIKMYPRLGVAYCADILGRTRQMIIDKIAKWKRSSFIVEYDPIQFDMKYCSRCLIEKDISLFYKCKKGAGGLHATCKKCLGDADNIRYKTNTFKRDVKALRGILHDMILNENEDKYYKHIFGGEFVEVKSHIESYFDENINWNNRRDWCLDHIVPVHILKDNDEIAYLIFHFKNLQVISKQENDQKGSNLSVSKDHLIRAIKKHGNCSVFDELLEILNGYLSNNIIDCRKL